MPSAISGFVAAKELNGSLRISLRPAVVSPIAFSALLYWLHDRAADRVLMSFCDRDWSHEMTALARRKPCASCWRASTSAKARATAISCTKTCRSTACRRPRRSGACSTVVGVGGKFDRERMRRCWSAASTAASCWWKPPDASVVLSRSRQRPVQARRILARALDRAPRRGPARLRLRQVDRRILPRVVTQARAEPRRRRRGDQLAAAVAPELPLPAAGGAVQRRGQLNHAAGASLIDPDINLRVKPG